MNDTEPLALGALYYPYIHIYDVNWLRANLLIFPRVKRMLPMDYMPSDGEVYPFTQPFKGKEPLLQPVNLGSDRSLKAQSILAFKLLRDSENEDFLERFGQSSAREAVSTRDLGFQIHARKLSGELRGALENQKLPKEKRLAWAPLNPEWYDTSKGYIEVHPRLGEAVMSTLAIACAQAESLAIVGDERSGPLHECLLEQDLDAVYDSWLGPPSNLPPPKPPTGERLMEFILGMQADLSVLSVEALYDISSQREPIVKLITALRQRAAAIRPLDDAKAMDEQFKDVAQEVLGEWERDRVNLRGFARSFLGKDALKQTTDFVSKVADKTLTGSAAGTVGGGWYGSLLTGGLIGAGAGLVVGLITHGGLTYYNLRQREKNSPYRFLTTLQGDYGLVFRSEAVAE